MTHAYDLCCRYFRTCYELQHFVCSFHLAQDQHTSVLLISSFEQFFAGETHMTSVTATMAYLFETLRFIQRAHGAAGQIVISGVSDAFLLRERHALRRWCQFLEIIPSQEDDGKIFAFAYPINAATDVGLLLQHSCYRTT